MTNYDDLRASLSAATPGPWEARVLGSEGYALYIPPDPASTGIRARHPRRVARFGYCDWNTDRANAEFTALARTAAPELLAEVDRLTQSNEDLRLIANVNGDWNVKFMHEQVVTQAAVARAETAEQAIQRVRTLAESWTYQGGLNPPSTHASVLDGAMVAILRAIEGGGH